MSFYFCTRLSGDPNTGGQFSAGLCSLCPSLHSPTSHHIGKCNGWLLCVANYTSTCETRALQKLAVKMSLVRVAGATGNLQGIYPMFLLVFHFNFECKSGFYMCYSRPYAQSDLAAYPLLATNVSFARPLK